MQEKRLKQHLSLGDQSITTARRRNAAPEIFSRYCICSLTIEVVTVVMASIKLNLIAKCSNQLAMSFFKSTACRFYGGIPRALRYNEKYYQYFH